MSEYLRRYQKAIRMKMKNFLTKLYIFLWDINELKEGGDSYIYTSTLKQVYITYI